MDYMDRDVLCTQKGPINLISLFLSLKYLVHAFKDMSFGSNKFLKWKYPCEKRKLNFKSDICNRHFQMTVFGYQRMKLLIFLGINFLWLTLTSFLWWPYLMTLTSVFQILPVPPAASRPPSRPSPLFSRWCEPLSSIHHTVWVTNAYSYMLLYLHASILHFFIIFYLQNCVHKVQGLALQTSFPFVIAAIDRHFLTSRIQWLRIRLQY